MIWKEDKTTGGKNGYGAKLTNIYSSSFKIELWIQLEIFYTNKNGVIICQIKLSL